MVAEYITSEMKLHKIKFGAVSANLGHIFVSYLQSHSLAMLMKYSTFARVSIYLFHSDEIPEIYAVDQNISSLGI